MTRSPSALLASLLLPLFVAMAGTLPPAPLVAQELPWLPGGRVSLGFAPSFWSWDSRYGIGPNGAPRVERLGLDLTASPLGSGVLPLLGALETNLGTLLGDPSFRVRLGVSRAEVDQSVLTFPFRLQIGITDWLTVGAMVPLVRPRSEILFTLQADSANANVGLSPQISQPNQVGSFLSAFQGVLTEAEAALPDDPAVQAARTYLDLLSQAYAQGTVFPAMGSRAAGILEGRLAGVASSLAALGYPGVPESLPLAEGYFSAEDFEEFLTSRAMRGWPLEDYTTVWSLGDIELTAEARLLRGGFELDSLGNPSPFRYQLGLGGLVRLGTGKPDDPSRFLDVSPGDGQMDLEGSVFGLAELGSRLGAWARFRYGIQREGEVLRRIAAPEQVLPEWRRLAPLEWTPGNYLEWDVNPQVYLTPTIAFGVRYRFWSKGKDSYALQPIDPETLEELDYPPPELLALETKETLRELGFSAVYSTVEAYARGEASLPLHLRATFFSPLGGSGGQTPRGGRVEAGVTLYRTFWGDEPRAAGSPAGGMR